MGKFSVDDLASGGRSAADALAEYDAIKRAVPRAAVQERQRCHNDPTRQAPSTLMPHKVGTVADRRRHHVRVEGVPRSPQAPLRVMLAEPRLADAVAQSLPVTDEVWAVPAGFPLSDPGDVPPSPEEAARIGRVPRREVAARRHGAQWPCADRVRQAYVSGRRRARCPGWARRLPRAGVAHPQAGLPRAGRWRMEGARMPFRGSRRRAPRRSRVSLGGQHRVGPLPDTLDDGSGAAPGGRWAEERHDDHPDTAGAE